MQQKTIWVKSRLHEQREYPRKTLEFRLKKGTIVEELSWDKKTEITKIYRRYILKKFNWFQKKEDKKHEFLSVSFSKYNLKKNKKKKLNLIKQIIAEQYPVLSYSFFNNFLSSTIRKIEMNEVSAKKFAKGINKAISKDAKKKTIKEDGEVV
jgi:hypothetical protein